jgi:hypothetical protein
VVQASPTTLEFAATRVGVAEAAGGFELQNVGKRVLRIFEAELSGAGVDQFNITGGDCVGAEMRQGESCTLELLFKPTVTGLSTAEVSISSNVPRSSFQVGVLGEGIAPRIGVDQRSVDFGLQPVTQADTSGRVVVSNLGSAPLEVGRISIAANSAKDFELASDRCGSRTLEPADECQLRLTFTPQAAGLRTADLTISSDSLEALSPVLLTGRGELRGSSLSVEPERLEYGLRLQNLGGESKSLRITNRGLEAITLEPIRLSHRSQGFRIGREGCSQTSLEPTESCSIEVFFQPLQVGGVEGVVLVSNTDDTETLAIPVSGSGAAPKIVFRSTAVEFDAVRVSSGQSLATLRVANEGDWPATPEGISIAKSAGGDFKVVEESCSGEILTPSSECWINLVFDPSRPGSRVDELRLDWSTEVGSLSETLRLTGTGTAPQMEISPAKIDFGGVSATRYSDKKFTISNRGSAPLMVSGIFLEESGRSAFERRGGSCENRKTLPPGEDCEVGVRFVPLEPEGPRNAAVVIQSNGTPRSFRVDLVGFALPRPVPKISIEPSRLVFDPVDVGSRSEIYTITILNSGSGVLRFGKIDLGGRHPEDFKLVPGSCQGAESLAPKSECTIGFRFTPLSEGTRRAELYVRHNALGDTTTLELSGEGVPLPVIPPSEPASPTP